MWPDLGLHEPQTLSHCPASWPCNLRLSWHCGEHSTAMRPQDQKGLRDRCGEVLEKRAAYRTLSGYAKRTVELARHVLKSDGAVSSMTASSSKKRLRPAIMCPGRVGLTSSLPRRSREQSARTPQTAYCAAMVERFHLFDVDTSLEQGQGIEIDGTRISVTSIVLVSRFR